ncbi:MAG TPA: hypothetical protein VFQ96_05070, partial [Microbacteriaceae bacterium]|nr:hypothetical protein [Microbacteriaceae bacterium]
WTAGKEVSLTTFARESGAFYLPPSFTADTDLSPIAPAEPVIVRGMGLAATDLVVLLTEGRGGRFTRDPSGLRYLPSGREPRLFLGSRRGVPYHAKITSRLKGTRPGARFFTARRAAELAGRRRLDFARQVWPFIAKEMLHGYYAELFTGHPQHVRVRWAQFAERFAPLDPFGQGLRALVAASVPDPADRLDLARLTRPLAGRRFEGSGALQEALRGYIRDDLRRRTLPRHSASLGLFLSLLESFGVVVGMAGADWTAASRARDLEGWWRPYFSSIASGPPARRLEELLALSRAGVVTFLGGGLEVTGDARSGTFLARGENAPGEVAAAALVDAWLPAPRAAHGPDPLLRHLVDTGQAREAPLGHGRTTGRIEVVPDAFAVVGADGSPHPARYALGPFTSAPVTGAFTRPGTNGLAFRENDRLARRVLAALSKPSGPPPGRSASAAPTREHRVFADTRTDRGTAYYAA